MALKKWWAVYPQGSKTGDEERAFFIALARHPEYKWRSVNSIATQAQLTKTRTEEIIDKYYKMGMVVNNPKNPEQWGYWETVGVDSDNKNVSVSQADVEDRLKKAKKP